MPVGAVLILTAILAGHPSGRALDWPLLLASLNTLFGCGMLVAVVWLAARSYQATGLLTFLMMGCGALSLVVSNLITSWVMPDSSNLNCKVTLFDSCSLFAGVCQLLSAYYLLADLTGAHPPETRPRHLAIAYAGIVLFACGVAALAVEGILPGFFAPAGGPSLLRQFVLGSALWMFALSGLMFVGIYFAAQTEFAFWYGLALLLVSA
jgi:hypothetical protein